MTVKKMMGIVALVVIGGIGLFIFILYITVKTKSTGLNKYEPFKDKKDSSFYALPTANFW